MDFSYLGFTSIKYHWFQIIIVHLFGIFLPTNQANNL